ncbi:MAG: response regulator [Planctomycetales bacterium]|nr:response regulator [Planctomycetales bacterium]
MNPLRIAVIDDDPSICRALARYLGVLGHDVDTFLSAEAFLNSTAIFFDHLVVDIRLPGLSGTMLVSMLRDRGDSTPVVFMTANELSDEQELRIRENAAIVYKPFDVAKLANILTQATGDGPCLHSES